VRHHQERYDATSLKGLVVACAGFLHWRRAALAHVNLLPRVASGGEREAEDGVAQ
jgi:hypothetical protein